jgi:hypothetical protein
MYKAELFAKAFDDVWPGININSINEAIVHYIAKRAEDLFYLQVLWNHNDIEDYYEYCTIDTYKRLEKQAEQKVRKYFEDYVNDTENWPLYRIFVSFYIDNWERNTYFEDYFRTIAHMIAQDLLVDMYTDYVNKGEEDGE